MSSLNSAFLSLLYHGYGNKIDMKLTTLIKNNLEYNQSAVQVWMGENY
jgi:hypothetical protein